jgi:hypothetical protein
MTKSAKDYLKAEIDRLITRAGEITSKASGENRSLDPRRSGTSRACSPPPRTTARIKEMEENDNLNEQIEAMRRALPRG